MIEIHEGHFIPWLESSLPMKIFIGEKEMENNNFSFKVLGSKESRSMKRDEFIDFISKKVEESNHG